MDASERKKWVQAVVLAGVVYFVVGIAFAAFARWSESSSMHEMWNRAAFVVSGVAFALHIGYEHFRLKHSPLITAFHVAIAVALGAFGLAANANVHGYMVGGGNRGLLAIALVVWPVLTALPAFVVAFVVANGLTLMRRGT